MKGERKGMKGKEGKGTRGSWLRCCWIPLELLTWYLPTLEMDDDDDVARGAQSGQFFSTYLYTKLLLLAAIMILKSHRWLAISFSTFFVSFFRSSLFAAH